MCACVGACVRACVRVCVRACVCMGECLRACVSLGSAVPKFLIWLQFISPFKYSFESLMINEFSNRTLGELLVLFSLAPTQAWY